MLIYPLRRKMNFTPRSQTQFIKIHYVDTTLDTLVAS